MAKSIDEMLEACKVLRCELDELAAAHPELDAVKSEGKWRRRARTIGAASEDSVSPVPADVFFTIQLLPFLKLTCLDVWHRAHRSLWRSRSHPGAHSPVCGTCPKMRTL